MENRRWLWIGACVLIAGAIFWGVGQAVNPSGGDTEFKAALEAMKQVKSFRGAYIESASSSQHSERLWEVDCARVIVHQQSHDSQTGASSPFEMKQEELLTLRNFGQKSLDEIREKLVQRELVTPEELDTLFQPMAR